MSDNESPDSDLDIVFRLQNIPPEYRDRLLRQIVGSDLERLERIRKLLDMVSEISGSDVGGLEAWSTGGSVTDLVSDDRTSPTTSFESFTPPDRVGRYQVLDRLGSGASGVVYRARHVFLDHIRAIKFYPCSLYDRDRSATALAKREGQILARLEHPNITRVYDLDLESESVPFLVEEYVEGKTLAATISERTLSRSTSLRYALQIADALVAAHRQGIVHRDLKPGNVLITGSGLAKVVDFSIARLLGAATPAAAGTHGGTIETVERAGTLPYVSPEQWHGGDVTENTDIWALGCVLFECLTARVAFPDGPLAGRGEVLLPTLSHLDARIAKLLRDCWETHPKRRPSAAQARQRLARMLAGRKRVVALWSTIALGAMASVPATFRLLSPVSAEWRNNQLILRSSIPAYSPTYCGGTPPPLGSRVGHADSELEFVLPRQWGWFRQTIAITGRDTSDRSRLTLLDWRAREVQVIAAANVSDDPALPAEMQWHPFQVWTEGLREPLVFAPSREIAGGLTRLHLFSYTGSELSLRASIDHDGHLELFPKLDTSGDGGLEQLALGWTPDAESVGGEASETGRSVLYAFDLQALSRTPWRAGIDPVRSLPSPELIAQGLRMGLSFPIDRLAPGKTSRCTGVRWMKADDTLVVSCFGDGVTSGVEYYLQVHGGRVLGCLDVQYTGTYQEATIANGHSRDEIDVECARLRTVVKTLTPSGWIGVPSIER